MSHSATEIQKKLKAAIARRLKELDVYVDDELPDYVMVMVANKKDKKAMRNDLNLFLGDNTDKFVDWLFDVIAKLNSANTTTPTVDQECEKEKKEKTKKEAIATDSKTSSSKDHHDKRSRTTKSDTKKSRNDRSRSSSREREREKERERKAAKEREREERARLDREKLEREKKERRHREEQEEAERRIRKEKEREQREEERRRHEKDTVRREKERVDREKHDRERERLEKERQERAKGRVAVKGREDRRRERSLTWSDDDGEVRLRAHKVPSVVQQSHEPPLPVVSSKVIVKRKLQPVNDQKASLGAKSILQRAVAEANMSAAAGYGAPAPTAKKNSRRADFTGEEDEAAGYSAPAPPAKNSRRADFMGQEDEAILVEAVSAERKEIEVAKETQFIITMNRNQNPRTLKRERARRQGESGDEEGAAAVVPEKRVRPRITAPEPDHEPPKVGVRMDSSKRAVRAPTVGSVSAPSPAKPVAQSSPKKERERLLVQTIQTRHQHSPIVWDGQIQLDGESDDDDEAQIDAVLAATNGIAEVEHSDEEPMPPTHLLSRGESFTGYSPHAPSPVSVPVYVPTPIPIVIKSGSPTEMNIDPSVAAPMAMAPLGIVKVNEKCRFWPNCTREDSCNYVHPNKTCGAFPSCAFGQRCLYIHPACRFNNRCQNKTCPFTHSPTGYFPASVLSLSTHHQRPSAAVAPMPKQPPVIASSVSSTAPVNNGQALIGDSKEKGPEIPLASDPLPTPTIPCRFSGQCTKAGCPFKHPSACRFGSSCLNPGCYFYHGPSSTASASIKPSRPAGGGGARFKWRAETTA